MNSVATVSNPTFTTHENSSARPHQVEAVINSAEYVRSQWQAHAGTPRQGEEDVRFHLVSTCGSGKTRMIEELHRILGGKSLTMVPTLALASQVIEEFAPEESSAPRWKNTILVASEYERNEAKKDGSLLAVEKNSQNVFVSTDIDDICRAIRDIPADEPLHIVCTYQSGQTLAEAIHKLPEKFIFDSIACDEGHVTAGSNKELFSTVLDHERLPGRSRFFITATPVIIERATDDTGSAKVYSMDDPALYGPRLFTLTFPDAVNLGLVSDFKVLVVGVDISTRDEIAPEQRRTLALRALLEARKEHNIGHAISFHADTTLAEQACQEFERQIAEMNLKDIGVKSITGYQPSSERRETMRWFKEQDHTSLRVLTNCRCLGVGVNIPFLEAIVFADPIGSEIAITQYCGRVCRMSPGKEAGLIIIPVALDMKGDVDNELARSEYRKVWKMLCALRDVRVGPDVVQRAHKTNNEDSLENLPPELDVQYLGFQSLPKNLVESIKLQIALGDTEPVIPSRYEEYVHTQTVNYLKRYNALPTTSSGRTLDGHANWHSIHGKLAAEYGYKNGLTDFTTQQVRQSWEVFEAYVIGQCKEYITKNRRIPGDTAGKTPDKRFTFASLNYIAEKLSKESTGRPGSIKTIMDKNHSEIRNHFAEVWKAYYDQQILAYFKRYHTVPGERSGRTLDGALSWKSVLSNLGRGTVGEPISMGDYIETRLKIPVQNELHRFAVKELAEYAFARLKEGATHLRPGGNSLEKTSDGTLSMCALYTRIYSGEMTGAPIKFTEYWEKYIQSEFAALAIPWLKSQVSAHHAHTGRAAGVNSGLVPDGNISFKSLDQRITNGMLGNTVKSLADFTRQYCSES